MKDLTIKRIIYVVIWVWFNFWPSDYFKFVLKCFELILFNGPFSKIYRNAPYIWAEWICLVPTSAKLELISNVLNVKIYPE